uniref:Centromere protein J C-terminal domain-containing protein n=1 Tax=Glossina brevipalpis TaxID=37001 RepID=A0A1A9WJU3_9MUSC
MLQNKTSSAPHFAKTTTVATQNEKQCDIVKRLEELNKWQEEQKRLLEERQNRQRQILGMEQQTMYEMLGLNVENVAEDPLGNANTKEQQEQQNDQESMESLPTKEEAESADYDEVEDFGEYIEEDSDECKDVLEPKDKLPEINSLNYVNPACTNDLKEAYKPKKPFLKRGEGLKQRFKIDPNDLRLSNLPRYKYANAHPHIAMKPIIKRRPGVATNDSVRSKKTDNNCKIPHGQPPPLETNEQRFQQVLLTSKNTCNSTPDPKTTLTNSSEDPQRSKSSSPPIRVRFSEVNNAAKTKLREHPPDEGPKSPQVTTVAWCQILDPKQVQPTTVRRTSAQHSSPQPEVDIFDLIKQKAQSGIDMNSSAIQNYMQRCIHENYHTNADDKFQITASMDLKTKRLQPTVPDTIALEVSSADEMENECDAETELENETDNSLTNDSETNKRLESNDYSNITASPEVRVRFTNSNDTHEYDKTLDNSTVNDPSNGNKEDDNSHSEFFQQFKNALFAALQSKADSPNEANSTASNTTLTPKDSDLIHAAIQKATEELQEKTDLIKVRLCELEREINTFKENNVQLMKIKQEHELERNLQAQEHLEAMGRLKDEKMQIEIRLHEERMKLEEERRKLEQQYRSKTQNFMAKERKEVEKLREQLVQIETQLKGKDHTHMAAQARLRSQMRNMEKDQKKLHEEIERLTKENKRLENETLKISRDQNNKLLQEINRNIAKLASPKAVLENNKGRLTPRKSVSKTIVTAAVVNRLQKQSAMGYFKKSKGSGRSLNSKNGDKSNKIVSTSSADTETTPDTSISEDTSSRKVEIPAQQAYCLTEQQQDQGEQYEDLPMGIEDNREEDDDILREMEYNPGNMNGFEEQAQYIEEQPTRLKSGESPLPPPSSPTAPLAPVANSMKREIINSDGSRDIWYPNGNLKKISADGMITRMLYYNKDVKETNVNDGTVKYYYAETNTWHTTYLDGLEILEFPTGQVEHRHKNGVIEIYYPNNSVKIFNPNDELKLEEWRFADGTSLVQMRNGDRMLTLPNGQKEIHTKNNKRREYPDGTVKTVYKDGSQETRYSNGRVRLKDKDGNLVLDTENKP